jgi:hypothetical protein
VERLPSFSQTSHSMTWHAHPEIQRHRHRLGMSVQALSPWPKQVVGPSQRQHSCVACNWSAMYVRTSRADMNASTSPLYTIMLHPKDAKSPCLCVQASPTSKCFNRKLKPKPCSCHSHGAHAASSRNRIQHKKLYACKTSNQEGPMLLSQSCVSKYSSACMIV